MKIAEDLTALLDTLPAEAGDWAALDADGTLWAADVAEMVWSAALRERWMLADAAPFLAQAVESCGATARGEPHADAAQLWDLYLADRADDWIVLKAMTACYAGYSPDDLLDRAGEVLGEALPGRTYVTTQPLIEGLRAKGLQVAVISGSPTLIVQAALRAIGIEPAPPVLGVEVELEGGRLGTTFREPITWEQGKVDVWRRHAGDDARLSAVFGDSPGDLALLRAAEHARVLVQPRPILRSTASSSEGPWWELRPGFTNDGRAVIPPASNRVIDL